MFNQRFSEGVTMNGRYLSINDLNDRAIPAINTSMFTDASQGYGLLVSTVSVDLQSGELVFNVLANKHFSDFSADSDDNYHSVFVNIPATDFYTNVQMALSNPAGIEFGMLWYFMYHDPDNEMPTKFPVGTYSPDDLKELVNYSLPMDTVTGMESAQREAFYMAGSTDVAVTTEQWLRPIDIKIEGIKVVGGGFDLYNYPLKIIALKAFATDQGLNTPFDSVDKVEIQNGIYRDGDDYWLIDVVVNLV